MATQVVLRVKNPQQAKEAVDEAIIAAFDQIEQIMAEEAADAVLRIQFDGFKAETGPANLQVRSGEALASMASERERLGPTHIKVTFGALNATPEVEQYLTVQEEGMTIVPRFAEKLAFPPGDAGPPIRDERGVQLFWASEFTEVAEEYGFAAIIWTEEAVLGRRQGAPRSEPLELLFIRRESVQIPPRRIIGSQAEPTREAIEKRITASLGR